MPAQNIILLIAMLFLSGSCRLSSEKEKEFTSVKIPSSEKIAQAANDSIALAKDSLRIDSALNAALQLAQQNNQEAYTDSLFFVYDSSTVLQLHLSVGRFFSSKFRHMHVRIRYNGTVGNTIHNVYRLDEKKPAHVLSSIHWDLESPADSIGDINGDGFKDLSLCWYGVTGCCMRHTYDVYVYNPSDGSFQDAQYFLSPSFSPVEKAVRGVGYGHPGETDLYKYIWVGPTANLVEKIIPDKTHKDQYLRKIFKSGKLLLREEKMRKLPKEYEKITGLDWFLGTI
ncbi:hypothetical protein LZZ85_00975 [Terrimonas sp. NA20]|uniref:VCBS repeat-containing protein n=1 Tax=Terrimonas ginsenosidimutans TaxID=2908004 RepID=A0ABS9KKH0_9BACT|nr:hypothetical protein [Terrimonas ginsenosidimutans]MCG2612822.1 hypothetical protein [Terrimonas ginsenosidimutans]